MKNIFKKKATKQAKVKKIHTDTDTTERDFTGTSGVHFCLSTRSKMQLIEQIVNSEPVDMPSQTWQTSNDEVPMPSSPSPEQKIKIRSKLPKRVGPFGSNHLLINKERVLRGIKPLVRQKGLDGIAVEHAKLMAARDKLEHSSVLETTSKILTQTGLSRVIGENVWCSDKRERTKKATLEAYKRQFALSKADRKNILNEEFCSFGVGTARSDSGVIYICQIFGG